MGVQGPGGTGGEKKGKGSRESHLRYPPGSPASTGQVSRRSPRERTSERTHDDLRVTPTGVSGSAVS
jgi:hypothetical protein